MTDWRIDDEDWQQLSCTVREQPLVNRVLPSVVYFTLRLPPGVEAELSDTDDHGRRR